MPSFEVNSKPTAKVKVTNPNSFPLVVTLQIGIEVDLKFNAISDTGTVNVAANGESSKSIPTQMPGVAGTYTLLIRATWDGESGEYDAGTITVVRTTQDIGVSISW